MNYLKFEKLDVWRIALDLIELVYSTTKEFPKDESFNLTNQAKRAIVSVALNIAEGSTSQSNAEQARFLTISIRSLVEVMACIKIAVRLNYIDNDSLQIFDSGMQQLFIKLQAFRNTLLRK